MLGFLLFPGRRPVSRCDVVDDLTQFCEAPTFVREQAQVFVIGYEVVCEFL